MWGTCPITELHPQPDGFRERLQRRQHFGSIHLSLCVTWDVPVGGWGVLGVWWCCIPGRLVLVGVWWCCFPGRLVLVPWRVPVGTTPSLRHWSHKGTEEMAQAVKCLSSKPEDMTLDIQYPHIKGSIYYPSTQRARARRILRACLLDSPPSRIGERQDQ